MKLMNMIQKKCKKEEEIQEDKAADSDYHQQEELISELEEDEVEMHKSKWETSWQQIKRNI